MLITDLQKVNIKVTSAIFRLDEKNLKKILES